MSSLAGAEEKWTPLFNGRDLTGWSGDEKLWSVEDGVVVGRTDDGERKITENSYLLLDTDVPGDFVLEFKAKVEGENSGVQYRAWRAEGVKWGVGGYQCDMHPAPDYLGMLYDERGAGILCTRGKRLIIGQGEELLGVERKDTRLDQWNDYRITAFGRKVRHEVNGEITVEVFDKDDSERPLDGILALQLHVGGPMKASFKDMRIRPLEAWPEQPEEKGAMHEVPGFPGYQLRDGFRFEKLHEMTPEEGSWVAMTRDDEGHLFCSDHYGTVWKVTVGSEGVVDISDTGLPMRGVQGLLWRDGVLWATSTEANEPNGLWRVDMKDGKVGEPELVKQFPAGGEHGMHGLRESPDGQFIYVVTGNHVDAPEFEHSQVPRVWAEDQLLPRRPDANGHATGRMAPGGWIARFRPDGSDWTLCAIGMRNCYAIAFNDQGDLFTYDADMEWDMGMPWYRPTRICQVVPGAEFGWRFGTGKWPESYEDSMPPLLNIGPGSPTALVSGKGAKFPARYQRALFAFDWTYATIHAVHLEKSGAGYGATSEEFFAGNGMPLTDAVIGADGALYFMTGGRRLASALWRIRYVGDEDTSPVKYEAAPKVPDPSVDQAWQALGSADRVERFEARTALEKRNPGSWKRRLERESDPWRVIQASIALARTTDGDGLAEALLGMDFSKLDDAQQINWLRAFGLQFARHGEPSEELRSKLAATLMPVFPVGERGVDRELCRMLCYLNAPGIVRKTLDWADQIEPEPAPDWAALAKRNSQYGGDVENLLAHFPSADRIHAIYCLRVVPGPWDADDRGRFFAWFDELLGKKGGHSYAGFLRDLKNEALNLCTPAERSLEEAKEKSGTNLFADLPPVEGPGQAWTVDDVVSLADAGLAHRDLAAGKRMFQAALCATCHRFDGEGGAVGPDLSAVAGRFSVRDLAEAIIDPNKAVSDQYGWEIFQTSDGQQITGRLIEERAGQFSIATNPFDPSVRTSVPVASVTGRAPSPASPMPPALINRLNENELKDLLALLLSGKG
ncbi:family 16 glycoside hydrolase [Haloferula sargassicola]